MSNDNEITPSRPADKSRSKVTQLFSVSDVNAEREGEAYNALIATLARIEDLAEGASIPIRHKIAEKLAEFGGDLEMLFARRDYINVQIALVVLEKAIHNTVFPF